MATYLTDLADVLRRAGLEVVEIPGWKTRGRPGSFDPKGILCHHTAGAGDGYADALSMATKGRPDLSPPLSQLALSRKGVFYVLAAGRANHAGRCRPIGGLEAYTGRDYGDGNAQMIGIEAQNRGTDAEGWTPTQYRALVRGVAALKKHYGWSIVFGHKETSTSGKVDPDFPMATFRRDVATIPTAPQEDEVTPEDIKAIAKAVADETLTRPVTDVNDVPRTVGFAIGATLRDGQRQSLTLEALGVTVGVLAQAKGVDPAEIAAIVDRAVRDRLGQLAVVDRGAGA